MSRTLSAFSRGISLLLLTATLLVAGNAFAQSAGFTYQGRLTEQGAPANGQYDLSFKLVDAGGAAQGSPSVVTISDVTVRNGVFTVQLDFGSNAFSAAGDRYLEISLRRTGEADFIALSPRQPITATPYATQSASATTATTAASFSGSLGGDVTGTQNATVISSIGGVSASSIADGITAANGATESNTPGALIKRDASGNFSANTITASLNGNASTATTATNATNATTATTASGVSSTAGESVIAAINAGSSNIATSRVSGDIELAPNAQQAINSTSHLINLKLVSTDPVNHRLGTPGVNSLLSLSASGTYPDNSVHDKERFRIDNDGSILSVVDYTGGVNTTAPIEGAGTRFMWYGPKAALRAGQINGTQWDDANIGLYSTAFGENVRALGDNSIVVGKNSVAANTGTVALGEGHTATGANSVALGYGASTSTIAGSPRLGTFVFSDRSVPLTYSFNSTSPDIESQFHPTVTNSFNVRAVNGSFFYTNTAYTTGFIFNSTTATMTLNNSKLTMASDGSTTLTSNSGGSAGVTLPAGGGSWNNLSDRNMKANFAPVNPRAILRGVLNLPISTWNYKTQDTSIRHIGPMAQDFFAAFKLGEGDKTIATIDPDGVALAAIQGLNEELKDRDVKIESLQEQLKQQQLQIESLKRLVCLSHPNAEACSK